MSETKNRNHLNRGDGKSANSATEHVDVVVVGAGLSGLSAARVIKQRGLRVRVVEASDRVGGRTWSGDERGGRIDFGGMYIGKGHKASIDLGLSLGLEMVHARHPGDTLYLLPDRTLRGKGGDFSASWDKSALLNETYRLLDKTAAKVGATSPWTNPLANKFDSITVATWFDTHIHDPEIRIFHDTWVNAILGASAAEISMLYYLYYIAVNGSFAYLQIDANDSLWIGGAQLLSERMALELKHDIALNWPVTRIEQLPETVTVQSGERTLRARFVVLALPPAASNLIRFEPQLPPSRTQLQMRMPMGRMVKVQVRYQQPFWRQSGLSGELVDVTEIGAFVVDVTRPGDTLASLVGFIGGTDYDRFTSRPEDARKSAFLSMLASAFGDDANRPELYHETRWPEQSWQRGGPASYTPPGLLSRAGSALREPVQRILFAGTEAATEYSGYMEGAVRAGYAAAERLSKNFET